MVDHLAPYRTYVIRCWQERCEQPNTIIYRYSLEIPATGERFGFTHSKDLIQALQLALGQMQTQQSTLQNQANEPDCYF